MIYAVGAVGFLLFVIWSVFIYSLYINDLTYNQRTHILLFNKNLDLRDRIEYMKILDAVSYNDHYWSVLMFRNPWPMYNDALKQLGFGDIVFNHSTFQRM